MDFTTLLKAASNPTTKQARKLLEDLKPTAFERWIDYVLFNGTALAQVAANSVWHPNGFLKIFVAQGNKGERVRIHVWPSQRSTNKTEDIHDHYWSFSSIMLRGQLQIQSFGVVSLGGECFAIRELPKFQRDKTSFSAYRFTPRGLARLTQISKHQLKNGNIYSMSPYEIHRVKKIGKGITATLVLQGPPKKSQTRIFLPTASAINRQTTSAQRAVLTSELKTLLISLRS